MTSAEAMHGDQVVGVGNQVGALLVEYRQFSKTLINMMKAIKHHSSDMNAAELEMSALEAAEQRRRESLMGRVRTGSVGFLAACLFDCCRLWRRRVAMGAF